MYSNDPIRIHRIERTMKDNVPRIKLENHPMVNEDRFKLSLRYRSITLENDGTLSVWLDKPDVNNLHLDCSNALLDDDIAQGRTNLG